MFPTDCGVVGSWLVSISCCATTHSTLEIVDTVDEYDKLRTHILHFEHHAVRGIRPDDLHSFA
jgi:hypothetical protein